MSDSNDIRYSSDGSYGAPAEAATWLVEQPSTGPAVLAQAKGRVRPEEAAGDISLRDYVPLARRAAASTMASPRASQQAALSSSSYRGMAPQPSQAAWETASDWPEHASWPSLQPSVHPPPPAPAESLELTLTSTRRHRQLHSSEFRGFIVQNGQVAWQSDSSQAAQAHMLLDQPPDGPPPPGLADSLDLVLPSPTKPRRRLHSSAIRGFNPRSGQAAWESISCGDGHAHQQLHQRSADPLPPPPATESLVWSLGGSACEHWHSGADLTWPSFTAQPAEQQPAVALERPATRRGPTVQCQAAKWEKSPTHGAANGIAAEQAAEERYGAMSEWTTDEQPSGNAAPPPSAPKATAADCAEHTEKQQLGCSTADILPPHTASGQHTAALGQWDRGKAPAGQQPVEAPHQVQQQDGIAGNAAHPPPALPARKSTAKDFTKRVLRAAKRLLTGKTGKKTVLPTAPAHTEADPAWERAQVAIPKGMAGDLGYRLSRPRSSGLGPLGCGCLECPELDVWHVREANSTPSTGSPAPQMSNRVLWRKNPAYSEGELQEMETTKLNLLAAKAAMDQTCVQPDSDADVSALACPSCLQREEEERQRQAAQMAELQHLQHQNQKLAKRRARDKAALAGLAARVQDLTAARVAAKGEADAQAAELGELKLENKLLKRLWTAYRTKESQTDNHLQKLEARLEDMADEMRGLEAAYEAQAADNDVLKAKVASLENDNAASFAEANMLRAELATSSLKSAHASQRQPNRQRRAVEKENLYAGHPQQFRGRW